MKIALVSDWLPVFGGAERVLAEFHALWPEAPIFTTIADRQHLGPIRNADIRVTALESLFRMTRKHQWLLPWMPRYVESIDLRGFDLVLSSSHAVAKGIVPESSACHICYCHTPMRYAWEMEDQYLEDFQIPRAFRPKLKRLLAKLRRWDLTTGKRVDHFIANSRTTQERIQRTYARESTVIHPPVGDQFFTQPIASAAGRSTYLAIGRLVPYKRFDLLIETANALRLPLTIIGTGHDLPRLRRLAGETVTFLGYVRDEELPMLYSSAKALLFPPFEDAGVVPLEAMAAGTPVIAFGEGGALDTVVEGVTGIFFGEQSVSSLSEAIGRFSTTHFDGEAIRNHARAFSAERFREAVRRFVENCVVPSAHGTRPGIPQGR